MNIRRIQELLKSKEGIRLEFKEAKRDLPNNLFDSVCAMLNRDGGDASFIEGNVFRIMIPLVKTSPTNSNETINRDGATTSIKTHKIGHKKSTYIIVSAFLWEQQDSNL